MVIVAAVSFFWFLSLRLRSTSFRSDIKYNTKLSFVFVPAWNEQKYMWNLYWQSCDDDITQKSRFWGKTGLNVLNRCNFVWTLRISFSWNILIQISRMEIQFFRKHFHRGQIIAYAKKNTWNKTHHTFFLY